MSIATIVTRGFGSFGSVNLLPTLGYGEGVAVGGAGGGGLKYGRLPQYPLRIPREPQAPRTRPGRQQTFRTREVLLGEWPTWTLVAESSFTAVTVTHAAPAPASAVEFPAWTIAADASLTLAMDVAVVPGWPAWSLAGEGRHRDQRRVRMKDEAFMEMLLLMGDE